jgi:hypothetical protein
MRERLRGKAKAERIARRDSGLFVIDASTFQKPLEELAITMTHVVEREGPQILPHRFLNQDVMMILRQMTYTYNLLCYLNADEKRDDDLGYRQGYSFVVLPLVRSMIDGFYNFTSLLDDPSRAEVFRKSGYRLLSAISTVARRYRKIPVQSAYRH